MFRQPLSQLTGISEINNPNSEILISPNPTTGIFTIHTEGTNIKEIKVFTVLGEEVGITNYKLPISPSTPLRVTDEVTMDMSGYAGRNLFCGDNHFDRLSERNYNKQESGGGLFY